MKDKYTHKSPTLPLTDSQPFISSSRETKAQKRLQSAIHGYQDGSHAPQKAAEECLKAAKLFRKERLNGQEGIAQLHAAIFLRLQRRYAQAIALLIQAKKNLLPSTLFSVILNLELAENQVDCAMNQAVLQCITDHPLGENELFTMDINHPDYRAFFRRALQYYGAAIEDSKHAARPLFERALLYRQRFFSFLMLKQYHKALSDLRICRNLYGQASLTKSWLETFILEATIHDALGDLESSKKSLLFGGHMNTSTLDHLKDELQILGDDLYDVVTTLFYRGRLLWNPNPYTANFGLNGVCHEIYPHDHGFFPSPEELNYSRQSPDEAPSHANSSGLTTSSFLFASPLAHLKS